MKKIVSIIFLFLILACNNSKKNLPEEFDFGTIEKTAYFCNMLKCLFFVSEIALILPNMHALSGVFHGGADSLQTCFLACLRTATCDAFDFNALSR